MDKPKVTNQAKAMRLQVEDLELKARYWEAQFNIRKFTLEAAKLQPEYDAHIAAETEKNIKLMEEANANAEKIDQLAQEGVVSVESAVEADA